MAENSFNHFTRLQQLRQEQTEAQLTRTSKRGRPRKRKNPTPVNILLSDMDKLMLRELAEEECLGMNDIITHWIRKEYRLREKRRMKEK